MKKLSFLLLFFAATALAQEPAYIHKQFGFSPKGYNGTLTASQKAELDSCLDVAKAHETRAKSNNQTFGDLFGVSISDCLASAETGKGWNALENTPNGWKDIPTSMVIRKLIGLD
ncbi:MAG: hypothetical protein FWH15_04140 [Betaproteobacteria bacterium]|nr:hypothetical protein [Betaproteobacteria bacterium]